MFSVMDSIASGEFDFCQFVFYQPKAMFVFIVNIRQRKSASVPAVFEWSFNKPFEPSLGLGLSRQYSKVKPSFM